MSSCFSSRTTTKPKARDLSVKEYEEKLKGKKPPVRADKELKPKNVEKDTLESLDKENIIMPEAVDVSDYVPAFMRKEKAEAVAADLSVSKEVQLRNEMVQYGKKFLGVRYKYGGKKPKGGFDCSGFTRYVYQHFDIPIGGSSRHQAKDGKRIPIKKAEAGDLIIFGYKGRIHHVAMVVSNDAKGLFVIHSTSKGVIVDNILQSKYWKPRIMYARRILGN